MDTDVLSRYERFGRFYDKYAGRAALVLLGIVVGVCFGAWLGGYLGCSRAKAGCEFRVETFEALGTWVGAIGTIAAVLAAVSAFRAEESRRRAEALDGLLDDAAREKRFQAEANEVKIKVHGNYTQGNVVLGYTVSVTNASDSTRIYRLEGRDFSGPLKTAREVAPGKHVTTTRNYGSWSPPESGEHNDPKTFDRWAVESVSITFKMHGRYWRRVGNGLAEIISQWDVDGMDEPG